MFSVKSQIQALDKQCGIWLSGKVLNIDKETVEVKWTLYGEPSRVRFEHVRLPVLKRHLKLDPNDWKKTDPRRIQRGDSVVHKSPDGSADTVIVIDENDPWNGYVKAGSRQYLYEHIKETSTCINAVPQREPLSEGSNMLNKVTSGQPITSKAKQKENLPPPVSSDASATKNSKKVTSSGGGPTTSTSQRRENTHAPPVRAPAPKKSKQVSTLPDDQPATLTTRHQENVPGHSSKGKKAAKGSVEQQKRTLEVENSNTNQTSVGPDQPQKKSKRGDDKTKAPKKTQVVKQKASTISIHPAVQAFADTQLTEEETEVLKNTSKDKLMEQDTASVIRFGIQAISDMEALENESATATVSQVPPQTPQELESDTMELPPPMSPLRPLEKDSLEDRVAEMENIMKTLQAALEEEVSKRKQLEEMVTFYHSTPFSTCRAQKLPDNPVTTPAARPHLVPVADDRPRAEEVCLDSTPLRPGSATQVSQNESIPPPEHFNHLKHIFETVLGEKVQMNAFESYYELRPGIQAQVAMHFSNPTGLARELMRVMFTHFELSTSNVRGIKKAPLDPSRVNTIRQTVLKMCVVPIPLQKHCWAMCVKAMDQANRNSRHYSKKLSL